MRTRRSDAGPIVAKIEKSEEKPIIRSISGRRITRSRLAIVELPVGSESDDECSIGDLAPYNEVKYRTESFV